MRDTQGFSRVGRMSNFMPGANENGGTEELYDLYLAKKLEDWMEATGVCFPSGDFPERSASKS